MELLIVSGLSGAGKSVAMNALEDIGFFCIDNVPAGLLPSITAFSKAGDNQLERVALSMDVRGCRSREQIETALQQLDEQKTPYKILFLDAPDDVLMRRYSETRRRHPISIAEGISTRDAFLKERQILQPLKERANYTINTGLLSTSQNKERICDLFMKNGGAKNAMRLTIMSFGFKFGLPPEADLVLDVRCLPNPFYVPNSSCRRVTCSASRILNSYSTPLTRGFSRISPRMPQRANSCCASCTVWGCSVCSTRPRASKYLAKQAMP